MMIPDDDKKMKASRRNFKSWYLVALILAMALPLLYAILTSSNEADNDARVESLATNTVKPPGKKIRQISLIGERNSGTRWTFSHLKECFNHSLRVERHLTRYKHWFQYRNDTAYKHDTLVVAQFRNPYDWLKAMQRVPHHAPTHLDLDWKDFVTTPWTAPRQGKDIVMGKTITAANNSTGTTPCQQRFIYQDIVSCVVEPIPRAEITHKLRFSEESPFYEMRNDGSGLPYDSIMDMRAAKIENMISMGDWPGIAAVWAVQYEFLLHKGTDSLLQKISEWTGVEPKCNAYPAQLRRERDIEVEFAQYISDHLNWTAEALIGYTKQTTRQ